MLERNDLSAMETMIKRIVDKCLDKALKPIYLGLDKVEEQIAIRLDRIEIRMDNVENRLDKVEARLERIEEKLDRIDKWLPLDNTYVLSPLRKG